MRLNLSIWRHLSGDAVGQVHRLDRGNFGIGLFALPTGVLASGFAEVLAKRKEAQEKAEMICPHCGRHIGDVACRSGIDGPEEMRAK